MLLDLAIENNVALHESVLGAHGIAGERSAGSWSTAEPVPPYYANLVTRSPGMPPELRARIALLTGRLAPPWSLKDSFACLDPESSGWRVLFAAQWYGCAPGELRDLDFAETGARFERVEHAVALARWEADWQQASPAPGQRVFRDAVLDDPRVEVLAARGLGGAVLNHSNGAVGISNVFAVDTRIPRPAVHRDVARWAAQRAPGRAIVGYGGHEDLLPIGFHALGPLRVWMRDAPEASADEEHDALAETVD